MRKTSTLKVIVCATVVLILCCFTPLPTQASPTMGSIRLEDLLEGISLTEQMRLSVKDITVGTESVKYLFNNLEQEEPSFLQYYLFKETTIRLSVGSHEKLAQLQQTLNAQHTDRLRLIFKDERRAFWKHIPGLGSEDLYTDIWELVIIKTPCDELTRIVYTSINSTIKEKLQKVGTTDKHINLNEVFDKLLHDEIEPYLASLDPISRDDPCFNTFQLLRWVKGEDVSGFDSGEYRLHEGLQRALEPAVAALLEVGSGWSQYTLSVKVVGHTDPVVVRTEKNFQIESTGIEGWDKIENPLNLRYSGCSDNRLTGSRPVYLDFVKNSGTPVTEVNDNCKLGAARAYVAIAYLRNKLGQQGVEYRLCDGRRLRSDRQKRDPS
jgi:flagellar motor protein MotB